MLKHTTRFLIQTSRQALSQTRSHRITWAFSKHEFHNSPTNNIIVKPTTSNSNLAQGVGSQSTTGIADNVSSILNSSSGRGLSKSFGFITENDTTYHLKIYSQKHNTHISLTKPNSDAIISISAGNVGFRKGSRGSYDAGYKLAAYVCNQIQSRDLLIRIRSLELILRGFGAGRKAIVDVLLGNEGRNIRGRISKVTDATRLKFGGVRSKNPRRI